MGQIDPHVYEVPFQAKIELVLQNVTCIAVVEISRANIIVLISELSHVSPTEIDERGMRIGLLIRVLVVHPMDGDPMGGSILKTADTEKN